MHIIFYSIFLCILFQGDASSVPRVSMNRPYLPPATHGGTFGTPQSLRVACGNCDSPFSVSTPEPQPDSRTNALVACLSGGSAAGAAGLIAARCPHCRKVTSVGPAYARIRWIMYGVLAIIATIIAISVTVGTAEAAKEKKPFTSYGQVR